MKHSTGIAVVGAALGLMAGCDRPAAAEKVGDRAVPQMPAPAAVAATPAGEWRKQGPIQATMTIAPAGEMWRISLLGGSNVDVVGPGGAADCELVAEGPLKDGRIDARVVAFEGEIGGMTQAEAAADPAAVTLDLRGDRAQVTTDYQGCGLGADLTGPYSRTEGQMASIDDPDTGRPLQVGATLAEARAAWPEAELLVTEGYPWARFAVQTEGGRLLTFDGENADLLDGSNSQARIGQRVKWSDLKPDLRIARIEPPLN